jgi:hypothetical protein
MASSAPDISTAAWWGQRRRLYNIGLVLAGLVAFVSYATVVEKRSAACPGFEITLFTILLQGVGYGVAICVANVFYNLGRWSEIRLRPSDVPRYRRWAFGLGLALSAALPFSAVLAAAVSSCPQV